MASNPNYCDITPEIEALAAQSLQNSSIDPDDYVKYDVKRGLRDLNGKGVLAGLSLHRGGADKVAAIFPLEYITSKL